MAHRMLLSLAAVLFMAVTAAPVALAQGSGPAAAATAHFDADQATDAYLATLSAPARARSDAYFEGGYWLSLWDAVLALAVAWFLLGTRLSARMRDLAERMTRAKWLSTAIYAAQYTLVTGLITLPWAAYEGYLREHQYGMSNQDLAGWLGDQGKGLVLGVLIGTIAAVAIYAVIRRAQKTWWLWGAVVAFALFAFLVVIGPTYVEPVFNKFYALADSPLKQQILALARANGIPASQVYEFDASKQTTKMSAHVSGMFGTAQISLNDNLMKRASPEENSSNGLGCSAIITALTRANATWPTTPAAIWCST